MHDARLLSLFFSEGGRHPGPLHQRDAHNYIIEVQVTSFGIRYKENTSR